MLIFWQGARSLRSPAAGHNLISDIERRRLGGGQLPDSQMQTLMKWVMTMLAEIFLLKLEALMRVMASERRAASDDPRFVAIALPH
jgi:hypothetical protein